MEYKIILGSTSESRKKLLLNANINISEFISSDIDERSINDDDPNELVKKLSEAKLNSIINKLKYNKYKDFVIIITADSIAVKDNEIRNKPINDDEKKRFLRSYSNSYVDCITGISLYNYYTNRYLTNITSSRVYYKKIPDNIIKEASINSKIIGYSCGGFAVDCPYLENYVERIEGDYENIMGISTIETKKLIELSKQI